MEKYSHPDGAVVLLHETNMTGQTLCMVAISAAAADAATAAAAAAGSVPAAATISGDVVKV